MARRDKQYFIGSLGPVILKMYGKREILTSRMVPGTMKQTPATKQISSEFGVASKLSRYIRTMYKNEIGTYRDAEMHNRLTVEVHHSLLACKNNETGVYEFEEDSFESLNTVEHLIKSQVRKRIYRQPSVIRDGKILRVRFEQDNQRPLVQFPGMSTSCRLTVSVALFRLGDGLMITAPMNERKLLGKFKPLNEDLEFAFTIPPGCLCVVSLFLRYYKASTLIVGKKWHAGAICSAMITPGVFEDDQQHHWLKMPDLHFIPPT